MSETLKEKLKEKLDLAATGCAIALGFAIPVSTAATNLLLFLFLLFFFAAGDCSGKFHRITKNPMTLPFLLFCGVAVASSLYSLGSQREILHSLFKYLVLLIAPLLAVQLDARNHRLAALKAFCGAMLLTLFISGLIYFGLIPQALMNMIGEPFLSMWLPENPIVFKLHITHGFMMALAAFILFSLSTQAKTPPVRWALIGLGLLAALNVLMMVKGRTGYLAMAVFIIYGFWQRFGKKGMFVGFICTCLLAVSAYQYAPPFRERIQETLNQAQTWQPGQGDLTSVGQRLDYYTTSLSIIRDAPWLGVGIGGFNPAYREKIQGTKTPFSDNPHNQYLMVTVQLGLLGLAALVFLYFSHWRWSRFLEPPFLQIAQGILLAYLVANLFNSFMLDFSERFFFVWASGVLFGGLALAPGARKAESAVPPGGGYAKHS